MENNVVQNSCISARINDLPSDRLVTSSQNWIEVKDVMVKEVITTSPATSIADAAIKMAQNNVSCVVVRDNNVNVGILSETDFIRKTSEMSGDYGSITVEQVMSSPVITIPLCMSVLEASELMRSKNIKRLPVIDQGELVGIVSQTDLIQILSIYGTWKDVENIMSTDVAHIRHTATVAQAAELMADLRVSCVLIMEDDGSAIGIFTERDLLKQIIALRRDPSRTIVTEVMSTPLVSVPSDFSVLSAYKEMEKRRLRRLVVVDKEENVCGIVTQTDIFRAINSKLRAEEDKNLKRLEESESNIFTVDLNCDTTYINPALMGLLRITDRSELIGHPFLPPHFWQNPHDSSVFIEELKKGNIENAELALKTKKGDLLHVTVFSTYTMNAQKELNGWQGIVHDITATRNAQSELKKSHSLLHAAMDSTLDGICVVDTDRIITSQNRKFAEMWHLSEAVSASRYDVEVVQVMSSQLKDPDRFLANLSRIYSCPDEESFCVLEFKDGRVFERYSQPQIMQNTIVGRVWSYHDATDRMQTKIKLESLAKFPSESPNPVMRITCDGRITYANSASEPILKLWGKEVEQNCPRSILQFISETCASRKSNYLKIICSDRIYSMMFVPILDGGYVNVYGSDITELEIAEGEMRALNHKLESTVERLTLSNIELQDFAHVVSHDLKSPIRAIGTLTNWLAFDLKGKLGDEGEKTLSLLFKRAERLNEMLDAILQYSGIGRITIREEYVNLQELVMQIISDLRPPPNTIITVGDSLPSIRCEKIRIAQVLHNLLNNAIKYADKSKTHIEVGCEDENDEWKLYVADNGPGIEVKYVDKIFELFETLYPCEEADGVGMGLSLVKKILSMYGGRIWVESQEGEGSTFFFTLPKKSFDDVKSNRKPVKLQERC